MSAFMLTIVGTVCVALIGLLVMALNTIGNKEREIEALRAELSLTKATATNIYELLKRSQKINVALNEELSLRKDPPPHEMLRRLLMLCHPDRHNNSEASRKATQYLLSLRK